MSRPFSWQWIDQKGGLAGRPKCHAKTKRGTLCRRVAVKGVGRCQQHGGGRQLLARYREELAKVRSDKRRQWLLNRIDRATRNAETRYLSSGRHVEEATARLSELEPLIFDAIRQGRCTREAVARWLAAVEAVRPYRVELARPLILEALLGSYGPLPVGADVLAGGLGLGEQDRATLFEFLGFAVRSRDKSSLNEPGSNS